VGGQIKEPTKVRHVPPRYPDVAKQARVQGVVVLEAVISPTGEVTNVKVLRGAPLLNDAAADAVRQWSYTPTTLNGEPVAVVMTVTVNFRLGAE
jgi:protein TonB